MPKAKIICTLGPASSRTAELRKMMRAGMDVVRLNFSHGTLDDHLERIRLVRELNRKNRRRIRILGDLEGYRIRIGKLRGGKPIEIKKRQLLWLVSDDIIGEGDRIPFDYRGSLSPFHKGQNIYIDDGNIDLLIEAHEKNALRTRVVVGGFLKEHKGVNMPDVPLDFEGLTDRDKKHIDFSIEHNLDFLAQSFVRDREDIRLIRDYIGHRWSRGRVVAKIENRQGIDNIDEIINICDGIMIARGDMGVSLPVYEVPIIQKRIIHKCNRAGKFVITATQMLESMTENRIPTRAEVSDVANAILDGTDYVMLSAETAVGAHPARCVEMMNEIVKFTEQSRRQEV
ncbi:MAG: pyruvate kinase [Phycisphaerae bacterium]|nr:pyruvate kinase [Phycisphaerae bacterium]